MSNPVHFKGGGPEIWLPWLIHGCWCGSLQFIVDVFHLLQASISREDLGRTMFLTDTSIIPLLTTTTALQKQLDTWSIFLNRKDLQQKLLLYPVSIKCHWSLLWSHMFGSIVYNGRIFIPFPFPTHMLPKQCFLPFYIILKMLTYEEHNYRL